MTLTGDIEQNIDLFKLGKDNRPGRPAATDNFSWWSFGDVPLWLDFSNPTIINLHNTTWNPDYVVIPENLNENSWVYLVITAPSANDIGKNAKRSFFPVAHPVCLITPPQHIA
jgi:hypothetical protein